MAIHPAAPSSSASHTLSYPAQTFAKLSPRPFLHAHLSSPDGTRRPSGRKPSECRWPTIHPGSISHASGSAVVRVGDTSAVCGIQGEILLTKDIADWKYPEARPPHSPKENVEKTWETLRSEADEIASLSLLVPNVELSTGCSPSYLPGSPPSDLAQVLSYRIANLLHISQLISADDMRIWYYPMSASGAPALNPNNPDAMTVEHDITGEDTQKPEIKAYWCFHITILFLSLDGNPFDAAWGSLLAALKDTKLPHAWWDADRELVLCSPELSEARRLTLNGLPIPLTLNVFTGKPDMLSGAKEGEGAEQSWVLADADAFEEGCSQEEITLVVDNREILAIEKSGGGVVGMGEMGQLIERATERWREWKEVLMRTSHALSI